MSGLETNPFFVLELPVTAGPREVEREAARLLGMLELGLAAAATYATPLGPRTRRSEDVRAAAAVLRDPKKRLLAELWATSVDAGAATADPATASPATATAMGAVDARTASGTNPAAWTDAMIATGWGRR